MNHLVSQHYQKAKDSSSEGFYDLVSLSETDQSFEELSRLDPHLPKGWVELAKLESLERVELMRDFWLGKLPFHPKGHKAITELFQKIDDIAIFLVKESDRARFSAHLVYSLSSNAAFFVGLPGSTEENIHRLTSTFEILPKDYLAFLQVHNGFSKNGDEGLIPSGEMRPLYETFQAHFREEERAVTRAGITIDPALLIPFYEKYGLSSYQCFFADWYPSSEMGNVYYSGIDDTISDHRDPDSRMERLAFESFTDWLVFYLEGIETKGF